MGSLPGVTHARAVRALQRAGFVIVRQSGHIIMSRGAVELTVPRNNPINSHTMFDIARKAGLTVQQFRDLL